MNGEKELIISVPMGDHIESSIKSTDGKAAAVWHLQDCFIEVDLEKGSQELIPGGIMRSEESEPAGPTSLKSPMLQMEMPYCVRGRNVLPDVNTELIKFWARSCDLLHKSCHLPVLAAVREQKIRLVDVRDSRIISATLAEKYVALSYVWGLDMRPVLTRYTVS